MYIHVVIIQYQVGMFINRGESFEHEWSHSSASINLQISSNVDLPGRFIFMTEDDAIVEFGELLYHATELLL